MTLNLQYSTVYVVGTLNNHLNETGLYIPHHIFYVNWLLPDLFCK